LRSTPLLFTIVLVTNEDLGFCGLTAAIVAVAWLLGRRNSRDYRPLPEAEALRADPAASERMSANEGRFWLTVTPGALVVQPRSPSMFKEVDRVTPRHEVRCVDVDFTSRDGERLNVYGATGGVLHRLQVDAVPWGPRPAVAQMLRTWGWPVGEHLCSLPNPPTGDVSPTEAVRWVPYWESPTSGWD